MPDRTSLDRRQSLLLVDDCTAERDLYQLVLEPQFRVLTAGRGQEGLRIAGVEHPDIVVLDVMMPEMDGWETCARMKRDPETARIPVVMLTAADDENLAQHAADVGAAAILRKPCGVDRLVEAIRGAIGDPHGKAVWGDGPSN